MSGWICISISERFHRYESESPSHQARTANRESMRSATTNVYLCLTWVASKYFESNLICVFNSRSIFVYFDSYLALRRLFLVEGLSPNDCAVRSGDGLFVFRTWFFGDHPSIFSLWSQALGCEACDVCFCDKFNRVLTYFGGQNWATIVFHICTCCLVLTCCTQASAFGSRC